MKDISNAISEFSQKEILSFEADGSHSLTQNGQEIILTSEDVEIISEDIRAGWLPMMAGSPWHSISL